MENEETKVTENSDCLVETIKKLQEELDEMKRQNLQLIAKQQDFAQAFAKLIDLDEIINDKVNDALYDIDVDDKVEDKLIDLLRDVRLEI